MCTESHKLDVRPEDRDVQGNGVEGCESVSGEQIELGYLIFCITALVRFLSLLTIIPCNEGKLAVNK